jgi:hypothetical protein
MGFRRLFRRAPTAAGLVVEAGFVELSAVARRVDAAR